MGLHFLCMETFMSAKVRFGLFILGVLLTACASNQTELPNPLPTIQPEPSATLEIILQQATPSPSALPSPTATESEPEDLPPVPSGCTVVTQQYSPEPTQQSIFPPVSSTDWIIGPDTAAVTLVEYGDFQ